MSCPICRLGGARAGAATLVLERGVTMVVRHVPAEVCGNCGEEHIDVTAAAAALDRAEAAARDGVTVEVREFVAARALAGRKAEIAVKVIDHCGDEAMRTCRAG